MLSLDGLYNHIVGHFCAKKKIRFKKKIETRKSNKTRMLLNVRGVFLH